MKVNVVEKSPIERTVEVTVEQKRVDEAYNRAFQKASKSLSVPGFRKGKVPPQIARRFITDDGLTGNVLEGLLPQAFKEAVTEAQVTPLSEPRWEIVQKDRGQDLIFKATFEVKPQLDIKDYKGVEVTQIRPDIGPDHVEEVLNDYRNAHARLNSLTEDRGVQQGDIALVDYSGEHEGNAIGAAQNYLMEIKPEAYIPGFMENLYGMRPGDEKEFAADFPAEYQNPELAGKNVNFKFKLHEIKVRQLPELDDEFAKTISDFESIDKLREDMLTRIRQNVQDRVQKEAGSRILFQLVQQVEATQVPGALVNYKANLVFRTLIQQLERQEQTLDDYLKAQNMDRDALLRQVGGQAQLEARIELVVDSIARQEGITVGLDEVRAAIAQSAQMHQVPAHEMEARMMQDGTFEIVRYNLLQGKVVDFLAENGKVRYLTAEQQAEEQKQQEQAKPSEETAEKKEKKPAKAAQAEPEAVPAEGEGEPEAAAKKPRTRAKKAKEE